MKSERRFARDASLFLAGLLVFLLPGCRGTPENHAPALFLRGLEESETVYGIVKLAVEVSPSGIYGVRFFDNGTGAGESIGEGARGEDGSYSIDWFTQETPNGEHTIFAVSSGGEYRTAITLEVRNLYRAEVIPTDVVKMTPDNDTNPPRLAEAFKDVFCEPVPLEGPINTAGAEDSPFITPDGNTFYFWFNADESKDVYQQAVDPMTGIYWAKKVNGVWQEPERLFLQYFGEIGIDGAQTVRGDKLWFVSIREGNYKDMDFWTADLKDGRWVNWTNAGELLNEQYVIGELHITADGQEIYFNSQRSGGKGGKDIWVTRRVNGEWQEPENLAAVNTPGEEGWPFVSEDGTELWFAVSTPAPAIYRSLRVDGEWPPPEEVAYSFAGEPTLDAAGNLYFAHHRWDGALNRVTEADIYVARRK